MVLLRQGAINDSAMQMLKLLGAGGHYPTNKLQADEEENSASPAAQPSLVNNTLEGLKGRGEAIAEVFLFAFYKVFFLHLSYTDAQDDQFIL